MNIPTCTIAVLILFFDESIGQIPNIYEFCSAIISDHRPGSPCNPDQCQGRPGKRGNPGIQGPMGLKGEKGEQGTCDDLTKRLNRIENATARMDLIPKLVYCGVGMKSGHIPDEAITASSSANYRFTPQQGRLDERVRWQSSSVTSIGGAWCAQSADANQWIQVDLGSSMSLSGVVTQGRPKNQWGNQNWVKTYKLSCGDAANRMSKITEGGVEKIFTGNSDKDSKVINKFRTPNTCRFLRLHPVTWNTDSPWVGICLRMEILRGECFDLF